jgi:hypothetical protein
MDLGTPLSSLESGSVPNKADDALMKQILSEMDQAGASMQGPVSPPMGGIPRYSPHTEETAGPMRPGMMPAQQTYVPRHVYAEDPEETPAARPAARTLAPRKNFASALLDWLRDPLFIAVVVFLVSLPALHTYGSAWVPAFYSVGGSLSWLGLAAKAAFVAGAFILYRSIVYLFGL